MPEEKRICACGKEFMSSSRLTKPDECEECYIKYLNNYVAQRNKKQRRVK